MSIPRPRPRALLITAAVTASASLSLIPLASAHTTPTATPKPTVVLVHGAFADASSWNGVVERLQRDGYPVIAPANPLRGLAEDSTYVASVLTSVKGPVILVGHSYGGAVISQAAMRRPPGQGPRLHRRARPGQGRETEHAVQQVPRYQRTGPRPAPGALQQLRRHRRL